MNGIRALYKRHPREHVLCFLSHENTEKSAIWQHGKGSSPVPNHAGTLILDFPAHGDLLQQPEWSSLAVHWTSTLMLWSNQVKAECKSMCVCMFPNNPIPILSCFLKKQLYLLIYMSFEEMGVIYAVSGLALISELFGI